MDPASFFDRPAESLEHALDLITAWRAHAAVPRPVIAIGGPVGSGKSTLAARLSEAPISTDDFLPDYDRVAEHERDDPAHADLPALCAALRVLREGIAATIPVWSFKEHRRVGERRVEPGPLIVCEGIHALHPSLHEAHDLRVFVDAPSATRWARWEAIERAGERGMGVERAREHFERVAEPSFDRFADEYRASAHLIVRNHG